MMISLKTDPNPFAIILAIGVVLIIAFGIIKQLIKINKQSQKLQEDNERLNSLKKKSDKKYEDFTDGHSYQ